MSTNTCIYTMHQYTPFPINIIVLIFCLRTAFNVSHFKSNTIRTQLKKYFRTRNCVVVQISQVETEVIFTFMNVKIVNIIMIMNIKLFMI